MKLSPRRRSKGELSRYLVASAASSSSPTSLLLSHKHGAPRLVNSGEPSKHATCSTSILSPLSLAIVKPASTWGVTGRRTYIKIVFDRPIGVTFSRPPRSVTIRLRPCLWICTLLPVERTILLHSQHGLYQVYVLRGIFCTSNKSRKVLAAVAKLIISGLTSIFCKPWTASISRAGYANDRFVPRNESMTDRAKTNPVNKHVRVVGQEHRKRLCFLVPRTAKPQLIKSETSLGEGLESAAEAPFLEYSHR